MTVKLGGRTPGHSSGHLEGMECVKGIKCVDGTGLVEGMKYAEDSEFHSEVPRVHGWARVGSSAGAKVVRDDAGDDTGCETHATWRDLQGVPAEYRQ